jgi:hypothetical protein
VSNSEESLVRGASNETAHLRVGAHVLIVALAVGTLLFSPPLAFILTLCLFLMAACDWQVTRMALVGAYVAVILLVPNDFKFSGAGPIDLSVERILVLLLLALWVTGLITDRHGWPEAAKAIITPFLALVGWAGVSLVVNASDLARFDAVGTAGKGTAVLLASRVPSPQSPRSCPVAWPHCHAGNSRRLGGYRRKIRAHQCRAQRHEASAHDRGPS